MAKADLTLPDGTKITVEGEPTEVERIVGLLTAAPDSSPPRAKGRSLTVGGQSGSTRGGPTDRVRALKAEGFFREKRPLAAVLKRLAEHGHIYEQDDLSPVLIRMTRSGELRRVKDKEGWAYVNP